MSVPYERQIPQVGMVIEHQAGRWSVLRCIASGPFSDVFVVADVADRKKKYAMKVERQLNNIRAVLKLDVYVLMRMRDRKAKGFPQFIAAGRTEHYKYCVMQFLGPDIGKLRRTMPKKRFSLSTSLKICLQTLDRLEALHDAGWLCRDVKAPNFAIGLGEESGEIYMLDFGFARQFRKDDGTLIPPRSAAALLGTFQYAPLAAHAHQDQAPKEDLESWFYMAAEIIKGPLPWATFKDYKLMGEYKKEIRGEKREAFLDGVPKEFDDILTYIDGLQFFDRPDYNMLRQQVSSAAVRLGADLKAKFDWQENNNMVRKAHFVGELGQSNMASARAAEEDESSSMEHSIVRTDTTPESPEATNNFRPESETETQEVDADPLDEQQLFLAHRGSSEEHVSLDGKEVLRTTTIHALYSLSSDDPHSHSTHTAKTPDSPSQPQSPRQANSNPMSPAQKSDDD